MLSKKTVLHIDSVYRLTVVICKIKDSVFFSYNEPPTVKKPKDKSVKYRFKSSKELD